MIEMQSIRRYRRISVGPEHTVAFRINGVELNHIPIANLSAGGCFAVLPAAMIPTVHRGYLLMDFILEHKALPETPICSRVVHVVPCLSQVAERAVGLGIAFLSTSPDFYEQVDTYVSRHPSMPPK